MSTAAAARAGVSAWAIDPSHSSVHCKVRHLMISYVRGEFRSMQGTLQLDESDISRSNIHVEIDASSIDTREDKRDEHLRSSDFLDVQRFPALHFRSTSIVRWSPVSIRIKGDLTIHGVTREITFETEGPSPIATDPWGNQRIAGSTTFKINRKDFGLTWNTPLETGGFLVGDEITVDIDVEFVKAKS